ncbi:VHS-domain-containing protein [Basidiobolus meristosporus CBS 931.73]|uniref:VHS-domain-containing protein n=1 Tax=Basidiobolus meristosporus CBS 931.73 TaxID=1314790 RepID=A0A1Y1YLW0_9FUNG|nr:VHS-domain-containing protein [Basidiobolus meristosporus CBS 931.73]|eukprot:ORX99000.1 VHS-domain-containing protein [Basidiobolus meristosporus CBS 931.73]
MDMFSLPSFNETEERLKSMIERACRPGLMDPDLALNLEICDLVNEKQKNYPRLAAFTILDYINARNSHVGLLGLELLDNCVKNCGHPFHLQIATKEFLNDLVKYFPKQQSSNPSPVQMKILELIKEWKKTICVYSRHKEDLVNIVNMFSLLRSKGYRFPRLKKDVTAVMNPANVLKSADELEEEDRLAQSAKLQELIRRGRPEDLEEANELMKIMSGYDTSSKPDYREEVNKELEKIEEDVQLYIDMLNNLRPHEKASETVHVL